MPLREYWETATEHYDSAYAAAQKTDIPFWTSLAHQADGPILEIACGTGRVGLELVRQGFDYTGVDISEPLLAIFREKLARESLKTNLHLGDMRTFRLNRKFALAMMPFHPFQHMLTIEDQLATLATAREHLTPGGLLAFDVFFPQFDKLSADLGVEHHDFSWTTAAGHTVRRSYIRTSVDTVNLLFRGAFIFRTYDGETLLKEEKTDLSMAYFTYGYLRLLLERTGFRIEEAYGSYEREPLTVEKEIILLARAV